MQEQYRLVKDLNTEDTWEFDKGNATLKKGLMCYLDTWERCPTIMYDGKAICDFDSKMANECFEKVNEI
ncbi:hypothetical protein SAMN05443270_3087 [Lacrimispora sphenoides]|uniref:hypothetical protein n=1 Tax=Lacrimispora sphenoides TaxID=29370 RepID=UPI0008BD6C15|nr:hypothetical protein [Lacrimispora sphenoides]SEU09373.1 hypothetical protein SAMN05443270_3087 [Lacrimispora sphenoides]